MFVCVFGHTLNSVRLTKEPTEEYEAEDRERKQSHPHQRFKPPSPPPPPPFNHLPIHDSSRDIYVGPVIPCSGITIDDNIIYIKYLFAIIITKYTYTHTYIHYTQRRTQQRKITMFTCEVLDKWIIFQSLDELLASTGSILCLCFGGNYYQCFFCCPCDGCRCCCERDSENVARIISTSRTITQRVRQHNKYTVNVCVCVPYMARTIIIGAVVNIAPAPAHAYTIIVFTRKQRTIKYNKIQAKECLLQYKFYIDRLRCCRLLILYLL